MSSLKRNHNHNKSSEDSVHGWRIVRPTTLPHTYWPFLSCSSLVNKIGRRVSRPILYHVMCFIQWARVKVNWLVITYDMPLTTFPIRTSCFSAVYLKQFSFRSWTPDLHVSHCSWPPEHKCMNVLLAPNLIFSYFLQSWNTTFCYMTYQRFRFL